MTGENSKGEIKMQNKKKRLVVPVALMVIAVAAVGIGYAITNVGETYSINNSTSDAYVVVTPTDAAMYEGVFNGMIYYDTHNTAGTKTYYLSDGQTEDIGTLCDSAIPLGEIVLNVEQVNEDAAYTVEVTHDTGLYNGATFYIGYATSEDGSTYSSYTYMEYDVATGATFGPIDAANEYVKIKLFVDSDFHTDGSATRAAVIDGATFTFAVSVTV